MKNIIKVAQYIFWVVVISLPLYLIAFALMGDIAKENRVLEIVIASVLFATASYLTLLILRNKFAPEDKQKFPFIIFLIFIVLGIYNFAIDSADIIEFIYAIIGYIEAKLFLQNKFRDR